jgi:hypothetical protein
LSRRQSRRATCRARGAAGVTTAASRFEAPGMTFNDTIQMRIYLANSGAPGRSLKIST